MIIIEDQIEITSDHAILRVLLLARVSCCDGPTNFSVPSL